MYRLARRCPAPIVVPLFLCMLVCSGALAAKGTYDHVPRQSSSWTLKLDQPLLWQRVTALGRLVVATPGALIGIDAERGTEVWSHSKLAGLDPSGFREIPGTPLVMIGETGVDGRVVILDSLAGTLVFDSRDAGLATVLDAHVLFACGGLLVSGLPVGQPTTMLMMFDLASGTHRWTNDKLFGKASKLTSTLASLFMAATGTKALAAEPFELDQNGFLLASGTGFYSVNARTGEFRWKNSDLNGPTAVRFFLEPDHPELVFVGSESAGQGEFSSGQSFSRYMAYRLADGKPAWPKPVDLKGALNDPVFVPGALVVSPGGAAKGKMKRIEVASGNSTWGKKGKGLPAPGAIVDHRWTDAGLVISSGFDSAWTNKGAVYSLNVLDYQTGALRLKKGLKVQGRLLRTETVPAGVLYITTHELGLVDPATGTQKSKPLRATEPMLFDERGDQLFAYDPAAGVLHRIDLKQGSLSKLSAERIKWKGGDAPRVIEASEAGVRVVATQNIVGFDSDGSLRFHEHYPGPRQHALIRALAWAHAVRAGMNAVASGMTGAAMAQASAQQEGGSLEEEVFVELAQGFGQMMDGYAGLSRGYADIARRRYEASSVSQDFVLMLVPLKPGYGLAQVDKLTGELRSVISLGKDREPDYQVDAIENRIFYQATPSTIQAFDLR